MDLPPENTLTVIDIASGCGALGAAAGGSLARLTGRPVRTVGYVERDLASAGLLVARIEAGELDPAPVWTDARTFYGSAWRGCVDLLVAGYPCQPFSKSGTQLGHSDPRSLWDHVSRIIEDVAPTAVFLENVDHHLRLGFRRVAEDLRALGFSVSATIVGAAEIGASHVRDRLFVLGWKGEQALADAHCERQSWNSRSPWEHSRLSSGDRMVAPPPAIASDRWFSLTESLGSSFAPASLPNLRELADGFSGANVGTSPHVELSDSQALRILGNSVDPLQVAYAFDLLWLGGGRDDLGK